MSSKRAIILMMDSFGVGASADAVKFGDENSDTFGHIYEACSNGKADQEGLRSGPLKIPNLKRLGLLHLAQDSTGKEYDTDSDFQSICGYAEELSKGKDTPSGHWEIAGVPVLFDWGYFSKDFPSFPEKLTNDLINQANLPGVLGNKHASGTTIIEELGEEHIKSGMPIVYTSADSVFQIAAHEEHFGLKKLYEVCEIARKLVDEYNIGRVIARPFVGDNPKNFIRTGNRKDYATPPPSPTLLDKLSKAGKDVISIGKIADIYAHQGLTHKIKANGNMALFDETIKAMNNFKEDCLIFTNFVDFDSLYGHRRNIAGYAKALEDFDKRLPELIEKLNDNDVVVITADHGCDPSWDGSDHTREHIPIIVFGKKIAPRFIGKRNSFADIGQSLADYYGIEKLDFGASFF